MDYIRVYCIEGTDPQEIAIQVTEYQTYTIPYSLYELIQQPLGLPDIVCEGSN